MRRCVRGPAPDLLARVGEEIGRAFAERRRTEPGHRFQWPRREGQSLYDVVRAALKPMTEGHCAYCDGTPIDATGKECVDHFRPKATFHALVCAWENLFLACTACNDAKREQWDELLLRPDDGAFSFERYFQYRFDTGELQPNDAASESDRARARRTIEIFKLNRSGACIARKRALGAMQKAASDDRALFGYRYLVALCEP